MASGSVVPSVLVAPLGSGVASAVGEVLRRGNVGEIVGSSWAGVGTGELGAVVVGPWFLGPWSSLYPWSTPLLESPSSPVLVSPLVLAVGPVLSRRVTCEGLSSVMGGCILLWLDTLVVGPGLAEWVLPALGASSSFS